MFCKYIIYAPSRLKKVRIRHLRLGKREHSLQTAVIFVVEDVKSAVSWACAKNLISGKVSGVIAPNDTETGAEAATLLMRLANSVN